MFIVNGVSGSSLHCINFGAATDSLNAVGVFFVDAFVWFVSALPVLAVLAAVAAAAFLCIRAASKRRKARKGANKDDKKLYEERKE